MFSSFLPCTSFRQAWMERMRDKLIAEEEEEEFAVDRDDGRALAQKTAASQRRN